MKNATLIPVAKQFRAARRCGVPIVAYETADPAAAIVNCQKALNGNGDITPIIQHDCIRGLVAINKPGLKILSRFEDAGKLSDPCACLESLVARVKDLRLQDDADPDKYIGSIIFMIHANRWLEDTGGMQAVWNARDIFEGMGCMLVLLAPSIKLPTELRNDAVVISEPLPDHQELDGIVESITKDAGLKKENIANREAVIHTMTGTSAFGARQALAMSVTREGVDEDSLWNRKRKLIEATPGLAVWKSETAFDSLGGLNNLKEFLTRILTSGSTPVYAIGFIDEIEKALAGATGNDLSGTSQDQLMVLLKLMQDYGMPGLILVGHAGCGKSEIAKAAGAVAKCPTISIDLGAMKDSLVGGSEARVRTAMEVFKAVSQDANGVSSGLFIATCNRISNLPPELRRRFTLGTFFVDLPTAEEAKAIWPLWIERYGLKAKQPLPECNGWTGAEIRACCDVAFRTGLSLREAAAFVVPIVKSAPDQVEALRKLANNRFLSASYPGTYTYNDGQQETIKPASRKFQED